ncbi:MAG: AAA family ATPase [Actinomycetota bacterium]
MADDPVLQAERDHLDLARRCLDAMRGVAEGIADYGVDSLASESLGALRGQRLRSLAADPDAPPFFGRTDRDGDEVFHIGRRHVRDSHGDPVVIDWRAPIARAFYRATPGERMGVRLRRRFGFHDGMLSSFEDEHLDRGENLGLASGLLREEIERPRVGPMRDIVATIQPDQDNLVRADLDSSLCIQGAPGTGKTAVGLHRAAYLLYTYPERLRRSGVLVVGPNQAFLHYIGQVLPALGEGGIEQTTVEQLVGHGPVRRPSSAETATLKGDARMAEVLRRAVFSHVAKPAGDVVAMVGTRRYRIPEHRLRRYVDDARRADVRWSNARERLRAQLAEDVRRQREDAGGAPSDVETARLARSPAVRAFVDEVWPAIDPQKLLARLYRQPDFLRRCARGLLDEGELALLTSTPGRGWSVGDAELLDELTGLIEGAPSYVHVVVDEAQDLSPMQCRAVARRCPLGSVTVLGDLAQATTPWAPGSWAITLAHLGHPGALVRPLTAGYRVPGSVLDIANRLLPHIAAGVSPASSVRAGVDALRYVPGASLVAAVRDCLDVEGSIGVIVPDARALAVLDELLAAGLPAEPIESGDDPVVAVVAASAAKGLEFDSVVLVEPAQIVAGDPTRANGLRRLYVTLTRAVSRLTIVHDDPLPAELAA